MFRTRHVWLAFVLLVVFKHANAQFVVESHEMVLLPKYCEHAQTFKQRTPAGIEYWRARLGPTFIHIHHYCWAIVRMHRGNKFGLNETIRYGHFRGAVSDIDYVLERAERGFVLLPEILTRRGEALISMRKYAEAVNSFNRAIEEKPDYWPAYKGMAEAYLEQSRVDKAKEVLQIGIERSSDPRLLQKMLEELSKN